MVSSGCLPSIERNLEEGKYSEEEKDELIKRLLEDSENIDSRTGLLEGPEFVDKVAEKIEESYSNNKRDDDNSYFSLVFLDLDNFKSLNDRYGHCVGDKVIENVGEVLKNNIRDEDIAARYGGDEFAVLLEDSGGEGARDFARRIYDSIVQEEVWEEKDLDYGVSIGVAGYDTEKGFDSEIVSECLLNLADKAMYCAKEDEEFDIFESKYSDMMFRVCESRGYDLSLVEKMIKDYRPVGQDDYDAEKIGA